MFHFPRRQYMNVEIQKPNTLKETKLVQVSAIYHNGCNFFTVIFERERERARASVALQICCRELANEYSFHCLASVGVRIAHLGVKYPIVLTANGDFPFVLKVGTCPFVAGRFEFLPCFYHEISHSHGRQNISYVIPPIYYNILFPAGLMC